MELSFLGRGAGFNPEEGSTAAFFVDNGELFLIDSGESTFHALLDRKILDSVTAINLLITHTHSDHVGSLGSLILYAFAVKKMPVTIVTDESMVFLSSIRQLLKIYGLTRQMYRFADSSVFDRRYSRFSKMRYVKTSHCDELASCGILFETKQGLVFYSGDMRDPAPLVEIIKSRRKIDKIYIDSNNDRMAKMHHISIHLLHGIVPPRLAAKIYCMHVNSRQCIAEAEAYGFNVVTVVKEN
ncbi:MAG: MBL fold metallo-hydrolase [Treponema sp.]|jgi:ribonuclease BN (tRNA processing enzyme)|nr:MBL fold metallo-hydrolase [Treponema sp.]